MTRLSLSPWLGLVLAAALTVPGIAKVPRRALSSFTIDARTASEAKEIMRRFDVETRKGNVLEVIVPADKASDLAAQYPQAKLVEADIHDIFVRNDLRNPHWHDGYHTFATIQAELNTIVSKYPTLASLENYGKSEDGNPLLALRLTGTAAAASKPEVLITSSTHGNEIATPEVVMGVIETLVQGYGSDPQMTQMLDKHVVYFIPVVCPDGYLEQSRETNGLDPNRDYPYPDDPSHTSNASVASEMTWFATKHIVGSVDIHSNAEMVMYPWAYTEDPLPSADLPAFQSISNLMGQDLGYPAGQISQILYIAQGSSADYWYWKYKTVALGLEMGGDSFAPDSSDLPALIQQTAPSLYHFIQNF